MVYSAVYYSSYIQARRMLGIGDRSVNGPRAPAWKVVTASCFSGFCTAFVRAPMDLMKTRVQVHAMKRGFFSSLMPSR